MIEFRGVSKTYGESVAVHSTDLLVHEGQVTVLIGPSGCGKSTLLRLIIGLIPPDTGIVVFEGIPVTPETVLGLRLKMGYVIQEGGLFPHLSARDNVTLMAKHLGWPLNKIQNRLDEFLELTRFPLDGIDRFPVQLSGGQRQRVSLMRALMLNPEVLLLDEPFGALDPMIRCELQEDMRQIIRMLGKTVVMVTHDIGEAGFFGDSIVMMRDGRIVQQDPFGNLVRQPVEPFVTHFINAQRSPLEAVGMT